MSDPVALEDIWDAPVLPSSPKPTHQEDEDEEGVPRPSKRKTALFLPGSDDEEPLVSSKASAAPPKPNIDALFDFDDEELSFQPLAPALDLEALRREADARHAAALQASTTRPSSPPEKRKSGIKGIDDGGEGEAKKPRRKIARLDDERLLGPDGFPALVKSTKDFKIKGKGHEASDLNRLLNVYQFWTHKLYPKTQFRDTVERVEKLCHSKRMHVALSVWRDEAKGITAGRDADDPIDLTSDDGGAGERDGNDASEGDVHSSPGPAPPSSASEAEDDDFDIDAVIREEEARAATKKNPPPSDPKPKSRSVYKSASNATEDQLGEDDLEAMWAELDGLGGPPTIPASPSRVLGENGNTHRDEDEDMWDIHDEIELESNGQAVLTAAKNPLVNTETGTATNENAEVVGTNDEGWDDMYL